MYVLLDTHMQHCCLYLRLHRLLHYVTLPQDVGDIVALYEAGYSLSLVALLLSLGILFYFK